MPTVIKLFDRFTTTTRWLVRIFLGLGVVIALLAVFIYLLAERNTQQSLIEQMLHRQQVIARAGAKSIEAHLINTENGLKLLVRSQRVVVMGKDVQEVLNDYISDRKGTPTTGAAVINREGKIIANANNLGGPTEIGMSVADRAYFAWAKGAREGEVYLGGPMVSRLGATKGQTIIPIASPIVDNGKFRGAAVTVVLLSKLTELYLNPLKISDQTQVYLVNRDGVLLYAPYERLVGVNYFDYLKSKPYKGSEEALAPLKKSVEGKGEEGKLDILLPNEQQGGTPTRFLIAYSPLKLGSTSLILAVASPIDEAMIFAGPLYTNQTQGIIFWLVAILIVLIWFVVSLRLVQRQSFLEGFAEGRDHR